MIRPSTDGAAAVNTELHWIPVAHSQPGRGQRVLVINKADGVARIDAYSPASQITHWQALPTFRRD
jgi:hypothetical protein